MLSKLEPQLLGGMFGRQSSWLAKTPLGKLQSRTRAIVIGLGLLAAFLLFAGFQDGLENKPGATPAIVLLVFPQAHPGRVALALLQDPVGLVVLSMVLATPVFCASQVNYISSFVSMNEANIAYRLPRLSIEAINGRTLRANRQYDRAGGRVASAGLLIFSAAASLLFDDTVAKFGMLASWNTSRLNDRTWSRLIYAGWWANPRHHFALAIAFWVLGIYFFYFLSKQLTMGCVFASYVQSIMQYDFGVTPNMRYNTDGYWGLRSLRHFMQWTYCSTLGHFVMTLGILLVWLPFSQWTVLMELAVIAINCIVVVYPSVLALRGAVREKVIFVEHTIMSRRPRAERDAAIANVWDAPNLPFRIRSTLTASTIYLLCPLILALVSSLLTR